MMRNLKQRGVLQWLGVALGTLMLMWSLGAAAVQAYDPLEPINRQVFEFNKTLDDHVLKPVATTYQKVVPNYFRDGIRNFFGNVRDVWSAANLFAQGRGTDGLNQVLRIGVNSTFGLLGWLDVASEMGLERNRQDLGQTLGRLGVGPGPYIVWPFLGPSTLRDSLDIPALWKVAPEPYIEEIPTRNVVRALDIVSARASFLDAGKLFDEIALDPYTFMRDGYLQRRRSLIYDGNPPEELDEEDAEGAAQGESVSRWRGALELQAWEDQGAGSLGAMVLRRGPAAAKESAMPTDAAARMPHEARQESRVQATARLRQGGGAVSTERPQRTEFVPAP